MNPRTLLSHAVAAALVTATAVPLTALANECNVRYQYNMPSGSRPQVQLTLSVGQTANVNRSRLDFVENTGINDVLLFLDNVPNTVVTLRSGQRDPAGNHLSAGAELVDVQCLASVTPPPFSPEAWAQTLHAAGATAETVATGLNQLFNRSLNQTLQILAAVGYTAQQAAAAAKAVFDPAAEALASGLRNVFNRTLNQTAQILRNIGYTAAQMAQGIKQAFDATATQVAQRLQALYNFSAAQTAALLRTLDYTAEQIGEAMRDAYQQTEAQVIRALRDAGYTVTQVVAAARNLYTASAQQVASWMREAGYTVGQLLSPLVQAFNLGLEATVEALLRAGYQAQDIYLAARDYFNAQTRDMVTAFLRVWQIMYNETCGVAGCPPTLLERLRVLVQNLPTGTVDVAQAIAQSLRELYNMSAEGVARALHAMGSISRDAAEAALLAAGFLAAEVQAALDAAYGAGAAIVQAGAAAGSQFMAQAGDMMQQGTEAMVAGAQATAQAVGSYTELVEGYRTYAPGQPIPLSQRASTTIVAKGVLANTTTGMRMASRGWQVSKAEPGGALFGPAASPCNDANTLCINVAPGRGARPGLSSITVDYPGGVTQTVPVRIVQHANIRGVINQPFSRDGVTLTRSSCDLNERESFDLQIQGENLALGRELRLDCPNCSAGTTVNAVSSSANAATVRVTINNINRVTGTLFFVSPHSSRHPETLMFRVEARTDCADVRPRR